MGILLAVLCGLAWLGLDVLRKRLGEQVDATTAVAGLALFQLPFAIVPLVYTGAYGSLTDVSFLQFSLSSVALNVVAAFLFLRAVQLSPLGLTIPYLSFTPVFTAVTSWVILSETLPSQAIVGILLVLLGALLLNPPKTKTGKFNPIAPLITERGSLLMVVVAGIWSVTPILDKRATEAASVDAHTFVLAAGIFGVLWILRSFNERNMVSVFRKMKPAIAILLVAGVLNFTAIYLQMWSYAFIEIAYVETIKRAIGVTGAIIAGFLFFAETDWKERLPGAALMVIGVALVVFNS